MKKFFRGMWQLTKEALKVTYMLVVAYSAFFIALVLVTSFLTPAAAVAAV